MSAYQEAILLARLKQRDQILIAGIPECRAALSLVAKGRVRIIDGDITPDGGSGHIAGTS
jgi:hypothetical protein